MTDRSSFSERLKTLRATRSKAEFARFLGFPPPVYQRYEDGRIPSPTNLSVIAERCSVSLDYLLGRAPTSAPASASEAPSLPSPPQLLREPRAEYTAAPDHERRIRFLEDQCAAIVPQLNDIRRLLVSLLAEGHPPNTAPVPDTDHKDKAG
jgi:transcriptional regulator with XRE-family HTH domain